MTADWDKAPKWAGFRTQDIDGRYTFWEVEPFISGEYWRLSAKYAKYKYDYNAVPEWRDSLEVRPMPKTLLEVFADEVANAKSLEDLREWLTKTMREEGMEV